MGFLVQWSTDIRQLDELHLARAGGVEIIRMSYERRSFLGFISLLQNVYTRKSYGLLVLYGKRGTY